MKSARLVAVALTLTATPAIAGDEWTRADTYREVTFQVLHVIDWGQTRHIAKHPEKFEEVNPLLGRHPSVEKVDRYMFATGVLHFAVSYWLPREYREPFQYITIGITASSVTANYRVGIKVDF